jgi:hypothetical protein
MGTSFLMQNPVLTYLGRISYDLYVYRGTFVLLSVAIFGSLPSGLRFIVFPSIALLETIVMSAESYRYQYVSSAAPAV